MRVSPALVLLTAAIVLTESTCLADYRSDVAADKPVVAWSMDSLVDGALPGSGSAALPAKPEGSPTIIAGPRPKNFPAFTADNGGINLPGKSWLRVSDPGAASALDFDLGDTVTLEAWVSPEAIGDGQQVYVVGKGRTEAGSTNQNYALRLFGAKGSARPSFLFRDSRNRPGVGDEDWHRWTASFGIKPGSGWHHIAVSYTFGKPDSIRGYVDGVAVSGNWDMGGPTELGPVVDDSELWIGSSMAGNPGSTFKGAIDEVAVYRGALSENRIASRYEVGAEVEVIAATELPPGKVKVQILERKGRPKADELWAQANAGGSDGTTTGGTIDPIDANWATRPDFLTDEYTDAGFAFAKIPSKYNERGVRADRTSPFMIRASGAVTLPPGSHRLLVRALGGARVAVDGKVVATTKFITKRYADNEEVPDMAGQMLVSGVRVLAPGHSEAIATIEGDGKEHVFTMEAFVGGKNLRPETGEMSVSISTNGGPFRLLTPKLDGPLLQDDGWLTFAQRQQRHVADVEMEKRKIATEDRYWARRHELAREVVMKQSSIPIPTVSAGTPVQNEIDRFIGARLEKEGVQSAALADDLSFLRRATLDLVGVIPSPDEIAIFLSAPQETRRAHAIDRLLADRRWADAWLPYWQDVLAENPAILKATLNNTGPFRFWLHDAFLDNKPMDRFITELVSMDGSVNFGGPAGFGIASQNDVPMASKAQILTTAFLGAEMKCARCHDAPSHPFNQEDLFGIAAMLQRGAIKVPITSSVPGISPNSHVTVTLKAESTVNPHWALKEFQAEPLPGVLRNPEDSREMVAAILTDPRNERFAQVIVNRVWKRMLGWGIVEPVDDWDTARPSHPELLRWLAREFVLNGYDLKYVTRLIANSHAYQRVSTPAASKPRKTDERLFEAQARRRMTAEQLVDSLFTAAGKSFNTEELNFDVDGRRSIQDFNNLGKPERAWQMTPLSNERDRPALALPRAQTILDVLAAYGWRESRPDPKSTRDHDPNVLQPASLANGIMGARITRLSDDSAFTAIAVNSSSLDDVLDQTFLRVLSRKPTEAERATFTQVLAAGFDRRVNPIDPNAAPRRAPLPRAVSWSNHLNAQATTIKLELERETRAGDPPTPRLTTEWREKMEDAVWALMLTPEFAFVP